MLKYVLLGFLTYAPMTGYELKQRIDRSTAHFWHAELSQIYVTLKSLEEAGGVASALHGQAGRPDRRIYTITPQGRRDFQNWLGEPHVELSPKKELLVLKMFFSAQMRREQALTQLQLALDLHRRQLAFYRQDVPASIHACEQEFPALKEDARMWEATRRFGEQYEELYVRWIEEMLEVFQNDETQAENPA